MVYVYVEYSIANSKPFTEILDLRDNWNGMTAVDEPQVTMFCCEC